MNIVEVEDKPVMERPWQRDGRSGITRTQTIYVETYDQQTGKPKRYPVEARLRLDADQVPYPPGIYLISPLSTFVGEYDKVDLSVKLCTEKEFMELLAPRLAALKKAV